MSGQSERQLGLFGMSEVLTRFEATSGDAGWHLSGAELEARRRALPPAPTHLGRLAFIIRRPAKNTREVLSRAKLSLEEGLPGDCWGKKVSAEPAAQLAVMQCDVAELVANGQPLALFGDNLIVELDLSATNLPVGSRVRVGQAVVEVTPMEHNGCAKFKARFGSDALRFVNAAPTRHLNLRGVYWRVIEPGEIEVGSPVEVISRPSRNSISRAP